MSSAEAIPDIEELGYMDLVKERGHLEHALTRLTSLQGVAIIVARQALDARLECVTRALQAFERVTVRHIKTIGR